MSLVEERTQRCKYTERRDTSAARAPIRALAEYLETITFPDNAGQVIKFKEVRDGKADPEEIAGYPSACVYVEGEVKYGAEDGSLEVVFDEEGPGHDTQLALAGEIQTTLIVHVWTNEDEHREIVLEALEDAFQPVEWMTGFQLDMPHYYGCRAVYQLMSMTFEDQMDDVARRYRKCSAQLMVRSPYARMFNLKPLLPRFDLEVG